MTCLLDTHAVIWAIEFPGKLSRRAAELIADEGNVMLVSAVTAFELATKVRLGKLPQAEKLHADYKHTLIGAGMQTAPVTADIALRAGRLAAEHRDPFDRLIAATALAADIPLLSADPALDAFGAHRIW